MTTQISAETLSPITYNQLPVITTELLAQLYGTDIANIKMNHSRNQTRFEEGKHYFKVVGGALKNLRVTFGYLQISPKTRSLIFWTERGAARHAKMLETDLAWEVFEKLEDCYFTQKNIPPLPELPQHTTPPLSLEQKLCISLCGDKVTDVQVIGPDAFVGNIENIVCGLRERGWIVIRRDALAERLAML